MNRMTVTLRRLVTWLLLAALPWQGVAAAAMVLCQPAAPPALASAQGHHGHHGHDAHAAHDAHDAHGGHAAAAPGEEGAGPAGHGLQADADHHCAACSICGHALAPPASPVTLHGAFLPEGPVTGALLVPGSRVAALPDKPPRG